MQAPTLKRKLIASISGGTKHLLSIPNSPVLSAGMNLAKMLISAEIPFVHLKPPELIMVLVTDKALQDMDPTNHVNRSPSF